MSGTHRDRDRDRDRGERSSRLQLQQQQQQQAAAARTNEYFVPKDGIDREVITADICRYLGNDALVRPGTYENPQTRVVQQGYFINAYRNLTTAMIADLKADSERWEAERRQTASRGQPQNGISSRDSNGLVRKSNTPVVEYRSSTTHQSRQYYGPTEAAPPAAQPVYPAAGGYQTPATSAQQQGVYDSPQYQSSTTYASQPVQGYGTAQQGYAQQDSYYVGANYVAGTNSMADQARSDRAAAQQANTIPRTNTVQYSSTPTYQQGDTRGYYPQSGPSPISSTQGYSQQPADPFYGRAAPVAGTTYDTTTPEIYDPRAYPDARVQYQETPAYTQAPTSSTPSTTATSGSSRRDRERDDRDSRHHGRRR